MDIENYALFIAPKGSVPHTIVDDMYRQRREAQAARDAFMQKHKAGGAYGNDRAIVGLLFKRDAQLPVGWRADRTSIDDHIVALPAKKTPEGKAIDKELTALPRLHDCDWLSRQLKVGGVIRNRYWFKAWTEDIGDTRILGIPLTIEANQPEVTPEGCTRIKVSEYYALKEALPAQT